MLRTDNYTIAEIIAQLHQDIRFHAYSAHQDIQYTDGEKTRLLEDVAEGITVPHHLHPITRKYHIQVMLPDHYDLDLLLQNDEHDQKVRACVTCTTDVYSSNRAERAARAMGHVESAVQGVMELYAPNAARVRKGLPRAPDITIAG
jgi:hypothetical protein